MKHLKTIMCGFLGVMLVCSSMMAAGQAQAKPKISSQIKPVIRPLVKAELVCHASKFMGKCPVTVMMDGKISSTGAVTVYYHFKRSDNAVMRAVKLVFKARGTKTVPFTWKIGKDGSYAVQLVVKVGSKEITSQWVGFMVDCDEQTAMKPQLRKFDPKLVQIPKIRKMPKFNLEKIKKYFPKEVPVDLAVEKITTAPHIYWYSPMRIYVRIANYGKQASPWCKLWVTLKSSKPNPKTGNSEFIFKYNLKPLPSGWAGWANFSYVNFWPCTWTVKVHVDATNIILEGLKEGNNIKYATVIVH